MALRAVRQLLKHGASTDLLCDGHSPLSLAVVSGNDMVCSSVLIDIAFSVLSLASKRKHKSYIVI